MALREMNLCVGAVVWRSLNINREKEDLISKIVRCLKVFFASFKRKKELAELVETSEEIIAAQEKALLELKMENHDLESRLETQRRPGDAVEFLEEFGGMDKIIQKVEEYDKQEILVKDLEEENRKLEEENKRLKAKKK